MGKTGSLLLLAAFSTLCIAALTAPVEVPPTSLTIVPALPGRYKGPKSGPMGEDPLQSGRWSIVGTGLVLGVELAIIPGSNDVYFFIGRNKGGVLSYKDYLAGFFDMPAKTFTNVTSSSNLFCGGMIQTHDGKVVDFGGSGQAVGSGFIDGRNLVRVYDYFGGDKLVLPDTTKMTHNRWYPTATLLPDHKIMIHGGTLAGSETANGAPDIEIWDGNNPTQYPLPKTPVDPAYLAAVHQNFFPFNFLLPTGDIWNQCDDQIRILKQDGTYVLDATGKPLSFPGINVHTQYPKSGSAAMRALTYEDDYSSVEILVFGGVPLGHNCTFGDPEAFEPASRIAWRIKITWEQTPTGYKYTAGPWEQEDMLIARSGMDAVLLPNGDMVLMHGGQTGCPGGTSKGTRRGNFPAFWPVLYQPEKPKGQRCTIMGASGIARMYHTTSALTLDGNIMIAGCDSCGNGVQMQRGIEVDFYNPSPTAQYEYRHELFEPPYSIDEDNKPAFVSINTVEAEFPALQAKYGDQLTIVWKSKNATTLVPVTGVSMVAPTATTHGFNVNQRVVKLKIDEIDLKAGTLKVTIPLNKNLAPPQYYLLFLLNGKTYSIARWVWLKDMPTV